MTTERRSIALNVKLAPAALERVRALAPQHQIIEAAELKRDWTQLAQAEIVLSQTFPQEHLRDSTRIRWIQTPGAGVEWLLTPEIRARRELLITNASGIHAQPIAEHSFGFILMFARQLHLARSRQAEAQWMQPKQETLGTLAGATLGILGVGAIGQRIAQIATVFGMRVIGLRRGGEPVPGVERIYPPEQLHALLSESDYIVNALPLTAATRGLLDDAAFAAMRRHAFLVNIGRGATIQHAALLRALSDRRIGGVGLDVTDPEPLPSADPLWRFENAIITPHYSGGRPDYVVQVAEIFLDNLERYLAGRPLVNVVDKDAGY